MQTEIFWKFLTHIGLDIAFGFFFWLIAKPCGSWHDRQVLTETYFIIYLTNLLPFISAQHTTIYFRVLETHVKYLSYQKEVLSPKMFVPRNVCTAEAVSTAKENANVMTKKAMFLIVHLDGVGCR